MDKIIYFLLFTLYLPATLMAKIPELRIISDGHLMHCQRLPESSSVNNFHLCRKGQETLVLTETSGSYRSFAAYRIDPPNVREVTLQKVMQQRAVLRDTPQHSIVNLRNNIYDRHIFLEQVWNNFQGGHEIPSLSSIQQFITNEDQQLQDLVECPNLNITTDGTPARQLNCQRGTNARAASTGPLRMEQNCELFTCQGTSGESFVLSYPNMGKSYDPPQLWSLRNGRPMPFLHPVNVQCENQTIYQRGDGQSYRDLHIFESYQPDLLTTDSPYDLASLNQRIDQSNMQELRDMGANCQNQQLLNHIEQEKAFVREYSADVTRRRIRTVIRLVGGVQQRSIELMDNPDTNMCRLTDGVLVDVALARNRTTLTELEQEFSPAPPLQSLSTDRATELFGQIKQLPHMAYGYADDGCYARAHIIHDYIKRESGLDCKKIWINGHYLRPARAAGTNWVFHVAVACPIEVSPGRVEMRVIDPISSDAPMEPQAWFSSMEVDRAVNTGTQVTPWHQIFTYSYTNADQYLPSSSEGSYQEKLERARETLLQYEGIQ